jgi:hypothetical protein
MPLRHSYLLVLVLFGTNWYFFDKCLLAASITKLKLEIFALHAFLISKKCLSGTCFRAYILSMVKAGGMVIVIFYAPYPERRAAKAPSD